MIRKRKNRNKFFVKNILKNDIIEKLFVYDDL